MNTIPAAVMRVLLLGVLLTMLDSVAAQQDYPNKPIRILVPFPPGGATTILARIAAQKFTESWTEPVIVDNRPGANGIVGTEALVKSPPDGYTLLLVSSAHVINPILSPTSYDALKDVTAVATLAASESVLVINPSSPANTLQEFIALAKSKPGQLNYGSAGTGNVNHLNTELFSAMTGIKMQHIPYKGTGPALTDLMGGQVQSYLAPPTTVIALIKGGKLKAIAMSGATRLSALPQVPTFAEAGLPGFDPKLWFGILAPAGTPKTIVAKLSGEIAKFLATPDFKGQLDSQGLGPFFSTADQFAALMKADMARYAKIIKSANIKLE